MRELDWKKMKSDLNAHDQWNAIGADGMVRKTDVEYEAYFHGKCLGAFLSLRAAKNAVEARAQ